MMQVKARAIEYINVIDTYNFPLTNFVLDADDEYISLDCMGLNIPSMIEEKVPYFRWKKSSLFVDYDAQYDMRFLAFIELGYSGRPSAKKNSFFTVRKYDT